jgi:hypothetical protein
MTCDTIVPVLIGGLLAAGGGVTAQWVTHYLNDRRTRRAVAGAFAGEIGAICSIIRRRKYLEHAQQFLSLVQQSQQPLRIMVMITQEYFTIYHSNSSAIGLLPAPLAMDIAKFYTQLKALMEEVRPDTPMPADVATAIDRLTDQINLLSETLRTGEGLVPQLQEVAK